MFKYIYKSTKVIYDAHLKEYQVYYRNWFFWRYDSGYKFDGGATKYPVYYCDQENAKQRAITRAENMLSTVEIWKRSNLMGKNPDLFV